MNLKKVFMSFALCLAILSGFSISASARTIDNNTVKPIYVYDNGPISGQVATNGSNLNVRRGPGTEYATIGSLSNGEYVSLIGAIHGWYYAKYHVDGTNDQKVGWIYYHYVKA